jgi:hypothetical protein
MKTLHVPFWRSGIVKLSSMSISGWWFGAVFIFQTDELIFFRGIGQAPTRFLFNWRSRDEPVTSQAFQTDEE